MDSYGLSCPFTKMTVKFTVLRSTCRVVLEEAADPAFAELLPTLSPLPFHSFLLKC